MNALDDSSDYVRKYAALALGQIGDARALDRLALASQDSYANVREAAITALGDIGDRRAVDVLVERLMDTRGNFQPEAARALGKLGDKRVVGKLSELLGVVADIPGNKVPLIEAIGRLGPDEAVDVLTEELIPGPSRRVVNPGVRLAAARALANCTDTRVIVPLVSVLKEHDATLVGLAHQALQALTERYVSRLAASERSVRWVAAQALGLIAVEGAFTPSGPVARAALEGHGPDDDPEVSEAVSDALALIPSTPPTPAPSEEVRTASAQPREARKRIRCMMCSESKWLSWCGKCRSLVCSDHMVPIAPRSGLGTGGQGCPNCRTMLFDGDSVRWWQEGEPSPYLMKDPPP
ncbi:MAG: HEAT repeat domain-containing protein [Planctomycetes bacterium]|nr:HEAT repeat domain-containing protein [Planctomycetota bacterium]